MCKIARGSKAGLKLEKKLGSFAKCSNCEYLTIRPGHTSICELTQDTMFEASYYICESWAWHGDEASLEKLKKGAQ